MPYTQNWGVSRSQSPFNALMPPVAKEEEKEVTPVDTSPDADKDIIEQNNANAKIENTKPKTRRGWLDWAQDALTVAGMVPGIGNAFDAANVAVSGGRAAYAHFTGDTNAAKTHLGNAALSAAAAIPIVGQAAGAAKLAKSANTIYKLDKGGSMAIKSYKLAKSKDKEVELAENRRKQNVLQSSDVLAGDSEKEKGFSNPFVSKSKNIFV